MRKAAMLTLALLLVAALAFAGGASEDAGKKEGKTLRVAVVTSPSGVDDGNFNYDVYQGVIQFANECAQHGYDDVVYKNVNITSMDWDTALKPGIEAIVTEYDVIILSGFQFGTLGLKTIAEANPDVSFMLVDAFITDASFNTVDVANVYAVQFCEQEAGFTAGMAAALTSKSKKVAVVNGIAYPSNVNYEWGFYSGVNYVNSQKAASDKSWKPVECVELASRKDANFGGNYLGTFTDATVGKNVGDELIAAGCDVIFVAAGGAGNGVFTAAKEHDGVYVIGCDADEHDSGFKSGSSGDNVVLTSALKVLHKAVKDALIDHSKGEFKGNVSTFLTAVNGYTGFVSEEGRHQLSPEAVAFMKEAFAKVVSGELVPAGQFTATKFADFAVGVAATPL